MFKVSAWRNAFRTQMAISIFVAVCLLLFFDLLYLCLWWFIIFGRSHQSPYSYRGTKAAPISCFSLWIYVLLLSFLLPDTVLGWDWDFSFWGRFTQIPSHFCCSFWCAIFNKFYVFKFHPFLSISPRILNWPSIYHCFKSRPICRYIDRDTGILFKTIR